MTEKKTFMLTLQRESCDTKAIVHCNNRFHVNGTCWNFPKLHQITKFLRVTKNGTFKHNYPCESGKRLRNFPS